MGTVLEKFGRNWHWGHRIGKSCLMTLLRFEEFCIEEIWVCFSLFLRNYGLRFFRYVRKYGSQICIKMARPRPRLGLVSPPKAQDYSCTYNGAYSFESLSVTTHALYVCVFLEQE